MICVLYEDDVVVAEDDCLSSLIGESASLCIGTYRGLDPGTFWSGMINDVRIYDRVVMPSFHTFKRKVNRAGMRLC